MNKFWRIYEFVLTLLFFIYLTGIMSFWRAFSIIHIKIGEKSIFITELMLVFSLPFIVKNIKKILILPKVFLLTLLLYFVIGSIYLSYAVLINKNLFALRDLVLFLYILFLPLCFLIFSRDDNLRFGLYCSVFSNLICIFIVRTIIFRTYIPEFSLHDVITNTRLFNYGLFFGITFPIYFVLFIKSTKRLYRCLFLSLLCVNIYLILMIGERSVWLSFTVSAIFLLLIIKTKIRVLIIMLVFLVVISSSLFYFDSKLLKSSGHYFEVSSRVHTVRIIVIDLSKVIKYRIKLLKDKYFNNQASQAPESKITSGNLGSQAPESEITSGNLGSQAPESKITSGNRIASFKKAPSAQDRRKSVFKDSLLKYFIRLKKAGDPTCQTVFDNLFWRVSILKLGFDFGNKSPIFGNGFGVNPDYRVWENYDIPPVKELGVDSGIVPAHNHLLTMFIKMGLLGLSLFLFINIYIFIYVYRKKGSIFLNLRQCLMLGFLASLIYWNVLALFFNVIESPSTSIFLWIISGLIFVLSNGNLTVRGKDKEES